MSAARQEAIARYIDWTIGHEGGFAADPADPGGATNFGVSLRYARDAHGVEIDLDLDGDGDVDAADIRALSRDRAVEIYRKGWWDKHPWLDAIVDREIVGSAPAPCQSLAAKVFDLGVNMGMRQAVRLIQRAVPCCIGGRCLVVDGLFGPTTTAAVFAVGGSHFTAPQLRAAVSMAAVWFYTDLADRRPASRKFLPGWRNRAYA